MSKHQILILWLCAYWRISYCKGVSLLRRHTDTEAVLTSQGLEQTIADAEKAAADAEDAIATLKSEIKALSQDNRPLRNALKKVGYLLALIHFSALSLSYVQHIFGV